MGASLVPVGNCAIGMELCSRTESTAEKEEKEEDMDSRTESQTEAATEEEDMDSRRECQTEAEEEEEEEEDMDSRMESQTEAEEQEDMDNGMDSQTVGEEKVGEGEMDSGIWSELPHDLIVKILAWLPTPYVVRMRTVCKAWNALAFSADDMRRVPTPEPWLLVCNYSSSSTFSHTVSALDPVAQKWYTDIPLTLRDSSSVGGAGASAAASSSSNNTHSTDNVQVCTSAGGLLLCRSLEHVLYTCNPLTKSWRQLPPCLAPVGGFTFEAFEMDVDASTGSFRIYHDLCRYDESDRCDRMSELYDSETDSWKPLRGGGGDGDGKGTTTTVSPTAVAAAQDYAGGALPEKIAFLNQALYWVAFLAPVSLRRYKLQTQTWSEIPLPALKAPIYRIITANLVECNSRLLLVAAVLEGSECRKSLRVWELVETEESSTRSPSAAPATEGMMMKWVDLEIKANQDSEDLLEMDFAKYSCLGRGNSISVFSIKASEKGKVLSCDLTTKAWHWIPLCPTIEPLRLRDIIGSRRVMWGTGIKQYLAFQPSLQCQK